MRTGGLTCLVVGLAAVMGLGLAGCDQGTDTSTGGGTDVPPAAAAPGAAQATFVNVRCPIMDNPIDPAAVTADLTRTFKGQKVAFCCGGCPEVWDRLSDDAKEQKLAAVSRHATSAPSPEG